MFFAARSVGPVDNSGAHLVMDLDDRKEPAESFLRQDRDDLEEIMDVDFPGPRCELEVPKSSSSDSVSSGALP